MDVVLVEICSEFLLNTHAVECLLIYLEFLAKMHIAKIPLSILHIFVAVNLNIHVYVPISMYLQNYTRNTHTKKKISSYRLGQVCISRCHSGYHGSI